MKRLYSLLLMMFIILTANAQRYEVIIIKGKAPINVINGKTICVGDRINGERSIKWLSKSVSMKVYDTKGKGYVVFSKRSFKSEKRFNKNKPMSSRGWKLKNTDTICTKER